MEASGDLDYAIVAFAKWETTTAVYGKAALSDRQPQPGDDLILIGHPKGRPLQISQAGCRATQVDRYQAALAHTCDSEPGSSGSPIFDAKTGRVLAINFGGYEDGSAPNVATPIAAIAAISPIVQGLLSNDPDPRTDDPPKAVEPAEPPVLLRPLMAGLAICLAVCFAVWSTIGMARRSASTQTKHRRGRPNRKIRHRDRVSRRTQSTSEIITQLFDFGDARAAPRRRRAATLGR